MADSYKEKLSRVISDSLDHAESVWKEVGSEFVKKAIAVESTMDAAMVPSKIPGFPFVKDGKPEVIDFIAMVVDMRNSTEHLKSRINNPHIKDGFQRVFYETSALLPAIATIVEMQGGSVTEYLGDGALALFRTKEDEVEKSIYAAYRAANICIGDMRDEINQQITKRYQLDEINLGVGLAKGKAMVKLVGSKHNLQAKAIGECVWQATKLSGGTNVVYVSEELYGCWPKTQSGRLKFRCEKSPRGDLKAYKITSK